MRISFKREECDRHWRERILILATAPLMIIAGPTGGWLLNNAQTDRARIIAIGCIALFLVWVVAFIRGTLRWAASTVLTCTACREYRRRHPRT